jgi:hypothetical protein
MLIFIEKIREAINSLLYMMAEGKRRGHKGDHKGRPYGKKILLEISRRILLLKRSWLITNP